MSIALHHNVMMTIAYLFNIQSGTCLPRQYPFGSIAFPLRIRSTRQSLRRYSSLLRLYRVSFIIIISNTPALVNSFCKKNAET